MKKLFENKSIISMILLSVAFPFMLCIAWPIETFGGNLEELRFSLFDFLPYCFFVFLALSIVIFIILSLFRGKAYKIVFSFIAACTFLSFLQCLVLNFGITAFPGDNVEAPPSKMFVFINALIWLVLVVAIVVLSYIFWDKFGKELVSVLCIICIFAQLVSVVSVAITEEKLFMSSYQRECLASNDNTENKNMYFMSKKNLDVLSKNHNIIVFVVDRFDKNFAETAFEEYPEIFDSLSGFTYYTDHIAHYQKTFPAVATMLTNEEYNPNLDRCENLKNFFDNNKVLNKLKCENYLVNYYTDFYYGYWYNNSGNIGKYIDNALEIKEGSGIVPDKTNLTFQMLRMSLYRCLPFAIKDRVCGSFSSFDIGRKNYLHETEYREYTTDMKEVYDLVKDADINTVDKNLFTFLHISGCHTKIDYDTNWETTSEEQKYDVNIGLKNSFAIINEYLKNMKKIGVYDNSTIIITGDHSAIPDIQNQVSELKIPLNTALFVKPSDSFSSKLAKSSVQTSHADIWPTIFDSENIDMDFNIGESVLSKVENKNYQRYYFWGYGEDKQDSEIYFNKYLVNGPGSDFNNWSVVESTHHQNNLGWR